MTLQNRVSPWGTLHAVKIRGSLMGNRGRLHNRDKEIVRLYKGKSWITCSLTHKNISREVMGPNSYTELFFLDEATAFSAGHRPCSYCQPQRAKEFKTFWGKAFNQSPTSLKCIDQTIHVERIEKINGVHKYAQISSLPNGACIELNDEAYVIWEGELLQWSFYGYLSKHHFDNNLTVKVLTPNSIVEVFKAGFTPYLLIESLMRSQPPKPTDETGN